ncbi:unnamed protein product, partial [marine sediment metagenome]
WITSAPYTCFIAPIRMGEKSQVMSPGKTPNSFN